MTDQPDLEALGSEALREYWISAAFQYNSEAITAAVLAVVLPAHERMVREQVNQRWLAELAEIHERRDDDPYILGPTCRGCNQSWPCATASDAARIARGRG